MHQSDPVQKYRTWVTVRGRLPWAEALIFPPGVLTGLTEAVFAVALPV